MTIGILILSAVCVIQGLLLIHAARENGRLRRRVAAAVQIHSSYRQVAGENLRLRRRVAAAEDALNTYQVVSIDKRDIRNLRGRQ